MSDQLLADQSPYKCYPNWQRVSRVYLYLLTLLTIPITSTTPSTVNNPTGRAPSQTAEGRKQCQCSLPIGQTSNRSRLIGWACCRVRFRLGNITFTVDTRTLCEVLCDLPGFRLYLFSIRKIEFYKLQEKNARESYF